MASAMALEIAALHGCNKIPRQWSMQEDALHKHVYYTSLGMLLQVWRNGFQLSQGSRQSMYDVFAIAWCPMSAYCIWIAVWELLPGPERIQFYLEVSLVYPEFALDMLGSVYAYSCRGPLESMD